MSDKHTSQERIFIITDLLSENHGSGLSNKDLALLVGSSEVNICRDLAVFERHGWITRNDSGKWRLSPVFGRLAGRIMKSYQTARLLLAEEENEYVSAMQ